MKTKLLSTFLLLVFGAVLMTSSCRKFETDDLIDPIVSDTPSDGGNRSAVPMTDQIEQPAMRGSENGEESKPVIADTPAEGNRTVVIPEVIRNNQK
jgi:hypothetical protein